MAKLLFLFVCLFFPSLGLTESFIEGKDYEILKTESSPDTNKTSIIEFFSFGCPWCFRIEKSLEVWVKQQSNKIIFSRVPVIFNKDWEYYAKAYYVAEALSLNAKFTPLLFNAILEEKKPLNNDQALIEFFTKEGVARPLAESAFTQSPNIEMKLSEGQAIMAKYHVTSVPTLVVNQHFKTNLEMAKNEKRLVKILDFLVAKAQSSS